MVLLKLSVAACGLLGTASTFGPAARSIVHTTLLERADDTLSAYNYIVVGRGTAGLTVADRLTESGKHSVLVPELGLFRPTVKAASKD